ncbi:MULTISPECIES: hypothetical protein [Paraburkholderia]|jgi:hypothetical protein|uniref:hypothetical protein n=1 Tax=Paraburkholderia TaxID=1822464 RepID=UPI001FD1A45D|nr:hypothetical protein [Paraburkholderia terricola]
MAAYKLILRNLLPHARIIYFHSFNHCKESKVVVFRGRKGVRKSCIAGKTTIGEAHPLPGTVVANDVHRMQITTPHRLQYCGMGLCQTDSICSPVLLFVGTDGFGAEKDFHMVFCHERVGRAFKGGEANDNAASRHQRVLQSRNALESCRLGTMLS